MLTKKETAEMYHLMKLVHRLCRPRGNCRRFLVNTPRRDSACSATRGSAPLPGDHCGNRSGNLCPSSAPPSLAAFFS